MKRTITQHKMICKLLTMLMGFSLLAGPTCALAQEGESAAQACSIAGHTPITGSTPLAEITGNPLLAPYGRLLLPADEGYASGSTLEELYMIWYGHPDTDKSVEVVNTLLSRAAAGDTVFYDIYTDAEKAADSSKADTGLFFFKGEPGAKFALCNAGGGFAYVGAMQDSFPHALEISKKGYNAFALIYRPDSAYVDLARALTFIFEHADALEVDTADYALWGGSAGARMAAQLGSRGAAVYGGSSTVTRAGAVIMQYTGYTSVDQDPPTYNCVGTSDGIASYRTMQNRINALRAQGTDAEIEVFDGLPHGFGLGIGTIAEGWLDRAVAFWERQMR